MENWKNNFLVLGEGRTFSINETCGSRGKKISINFNKVSIKNSLSLHYNADNTS